MTFSFTYFDNSDRRSVKHISANERYIDCNFGLCQEFKKMTKGDIFLCILIENYSILIQIKGY